MTGTAVTVLPPNYYIKTGQTGAQTQIDIAHTSTWTITPSQSWILGGADLTMKDGSGTTTTITLSIYAGTSASGTLLQSVTLINAQFKSLHGNGGGTRDTSYDYVPFVFATPQTLSAGQTYFVTLTSGAPGPQAQAYFIKGANSLSFINSSGTAAPGTMSFVATIPPLIAVAITSISKDSLTAPTGTSSDFITTIGSGQTINGTLSVALTGTQTLWGSLDGGTTWTNITGSISGGTTIAWTGQTLTGSNSIVFTVVDESNTQPSAANATIDGTATHSYSVVAPSLTLTKLVEDVTAGATSFTTTASVKTGDHLVYDLRLVNATGAAISAAYNIDIKDLLTETSPNLILEVGTVRVNGVNTGVIKGNTAGDTGVEVSVGTIAAGATIDVTFTADVGGSVANGTIITNTGTFTADSLNTADKANSGWTNTVSNGTASATASLPVAVTVTSISKDTGTAGDFITTIGASQTINGTLSWPLAGSQTLWGSLNGGTTWAQIPAGNISGTAIAWTGQTLTGTNAIIFKVMPTATSPATGGATADATSASKTYAVLAPQLTLTKLVKEVTTGGAVYAASTTANPGDHLLFDLHLVNATGSAVSAAYNIDLNDLLTEAGGNLVLEAGSVVVTGGSGATIVKGNRTSGTPDSGVDVTIGTLAAGGTVDVTFTADLISGVQPGTVISNTGSYTANSLTSAEITSFGSAANVQSSGTATATAVLPLTVTIISLSKDTGTPGDFVTTTGTSQTVNGTLSRALTGTQTLWGSLDGGTTWTNITTSISGGTTIAWTGRTLGASSSIIFKVMPTATAPVSASTSAVATATEPYIVLAPNLSLTKKIQNLTANASGFAATTTAAPGDHLKYDLHLVNTAGSGTSAAYAIDIRDLLATGLILEAGTVAVNGGTGAIVVTGNAAGATSIEATIATLAAGGTVDITFTADVGGAVAGGTTITNTGSYTANSLSAAEITSFGSGSNTVSSGTASAAAVLPAGITVSVDSISKDTGTSTDFITTLGTGQTIAGTLGRALNAGEYLWGSRDGGTTWTQIPGGSISGTAIAWSGQSLSGSSTIVFDVTASATAPGTAGAAVIATASHAYAIVAPSLTLTKSVENLTAGATSFTPSTAAYPGDHVKYDLHLVNASGSAISSAYQIHIKDLLATGLALEAGTITVTGGTGTSVVTGNTAGDTTIDVSIGTLAAGGTVDVWFTADVGGAVAANSDLQNTGTATAETIASGDPLYASKSSLTLTATADVNVASHAASLTKTLVATSDANTAGSALAIGEYATYDLTATLDTGTQTLVIDDTLSTGLKYTGYTVTHIGNGITGMPSSPTVTGASTQDPTFNFGTITVSTANAADTTVTLRVVEQLDPATTLTAGAIVSDVGRVTVGGASISAYAAATATGTVALPTISFAKTQDPTNGAVLYPGYVNTFHLTASNAPAANAPAYGVRLHDSLPSGLSLGSGTIVVKDGASTLSAGSDYTLTTAGGASGTLDVLLAGALLAGHTITVDYQATIAPGATGTLTNNATAAWRTQPGSGGTTGSSTASVSEAVSPSPVISKTEVGHSDSHVAAGSLTIGEYATFDVVATLAPGTQTLSIDDTLNPGLTFISGTVTNVGSGITGIFAAPSVNLTNPLDPLFAFGTVTASSAVGADTTVTLEIVTQLTGSTLTAGSTVGDTARVSVGAAGGGSASASGSAADIVVKPAITFTKTVDSTGNAALYPGYVNTWHLNAVSATGANTGPAYNVVLHDVISAGLVLDPSSVILTDRHGDGSTTTLQPGSDYGVTVSNSRTMDIQLDHFYPVLPGDTLTATYRTAIAAGTFGTTPGNTANMTWSTGSGVSGTAAAGPSSTSPTVALSETVAAAPTISKTRFASSDSLIAAGSLAIGEYVTYDLAATLAVGTQSVILDDRLSDGLSYVSATLLSAGSAITDAGGGSVTLRSISTTSTSDPAFDLGALTVSATGNRTVTLRVVEQAVDPSGTLTAGTPLSDTATVTVPAGAGTAAASATKTDTLVTPALTFSKTQDVPAGVVLYPGYVNTYHLIAVSTGTGPAYQVTLHDVLSAGQTLATGTIVVTDRHANGTTETLVRNTAYTVVTTSTTMDIELGNSVAILPGDTLTATYQATIGAVAAGTTLTNTANATWASQPGGTVATGASAPSSVSETVSAAPTLTKRLVKVAPPAGSPIVAGANSGLTSVLSTQLGQGATLTYDLIAVLGVGTQTLSFTDVLPAGLVFQSASVLSATNLAGLPSLPAVTVSAGTGNTKIFKLGTVTDVAAPGTVILEVVATVASGAVFSGSIANSATVTAATPGSTTSTSAASAQLSTTVITPPTVTIKQLPAVSSTAYTGQRLAGLSCDDTTKSNIITGTGAAGGTVVITENGTTLGSPTVQGNGTWSFTAAGLSQGTHHLVATEADNAGNVGAPAYYDFIYDTLPPHVTMGLTMSGTSVAKISGIGDPGTTVLIGNGKTTLASATPALNGNWALLPSTSLAKLPGFIASQTDFAGNTGIAIAGKAMSVTIAANTNTWLTDAGTRSAVKVAGGGGDLILDFSSDPTATVDLTGIGALTWVSTSGTGATTDIRYAASSNNIQHFIDIIGPTGLNVTHL